MSTEPQTGLARHLTTELPFHVRETIGAKLRGLRRDNRLRLEDVHSQTGISIGELSELERGMIPNPRLGDILALRDLYGFPALEYLFGEIDWPTGRISLEQ